MSGPVNALDAIALSSPQQRLLRVVALACPLVLLVAIPLAGGVFHPVFTAAGVLLAGLVALYPESHAPLGAVLYLGLLWALSLPQALDAWTLLAAADLLLLHLVCTLLCYGPPGLTLDPALLALWRRRAVVCFAAAVLVWVAAGALDLADLPSSGTGVGLALLLVIGWVGVLGRHLLPGRTY